MSGQHARPFTVGLTGGIGSGKTTVANLFNTYGATLIDADAVSHALTGPNATGTHAIESAFGPQMLSETGALNRAAMRELVFAQPEARRQLESILHPLIRTEMFRQLDAAVSAPYVLWIVPLLVEHIDAHAHCHRILVVDCDPETQLARLQSRSGIGDAQARAMLASQTSRETRLHHADDVIDNTRDLVHLEPHVKMLDHFYRSVATAKSAPL